MGDRIETLATYVGDMHALEKHLLEAFERQLNLTEDSPQAHQVVQQLVDSSRRHIDQLEQRLTAIGHPSKGVTDTVKAAVAGIFGVAAGARMPNQVSTSNPGSPDSAIVGNSVNAGTRRALVTASPRRRPAFTCGPID